MSADKDRGIRRQKQKRAKASKAQEKKAHPGPVPTGAPGKSATTKPAG